MKFQSEAEKKETKCTQLWAYAGLGVEKQFFIYSIFPFQHWHIYIHFWPRFFMLRLDFITEQQRGDLYVLSK